MRYRCARDAKGLVPLPRLLLYVAKNRSEAEPDAARPDACLLRKGAPNIHNQHKPISLIPFFCHTVHHFLPLLFNGRMILFYL